MTQNFDLLWISDRMEDQEEKTPLNSDYPQSLSLSQMYLLKKVEVLEFSLERKVRNIILLLCNCEHDICTHTHIITSELLV